jgi:hypothetical protein
VLEYGRTFIVIPAAAYQPSCWATKKPVWSVFGVQSRARRTVAGGPGVIDGSPTLGDGLDPPADGAFDPDGAFDADGGGDPAPEEHEATIEARHSATIDRRKALFTKSDSCEDARTFGMQKRRPNGDGV